MIAGGLVDTVNVEPLPPLLDWPFTVTITFPLEAPFGTDVTILLAVQLDAVADTPLNVTALVPWDAPKFVPLIVTEVPTPPEVGDRLVTVGPPVTVNVTPLLTTPFTVTKTLPVLAPVGTDVLI